MKKFVVLSLMILGLGAFSFAQEINQVRFDMSSADLKKALNAGEITFFFNKTADADAIKNSTQYYTNYFTVNHDKASGKTVLKLTKDDMAKMVVSRFLQSNGITEVLIDGKVITIQDFVAEYLR
jgi:plasmid replication initiation protein